jgi:hypothetical protein
MLAKSLNNMSEHACVAQSVCEVEYYCAVDVTKERLHLHRLMGEIFNEPVDGTTTIWGDNQSTIANFEDTLISEKTKHIGLKWHFLQDHV